MKAQFSIYVGPTPIFSEDPILAHPKDINTKPGSSVEFSVTTAITAKACIWYFQERPISSEETEYRGSTTSILSITRCLPKHKGAYKCAVSTESGQTFYSESAALTIGEHRSARDIFKYGCDVS